MKTLLDIFNQTTHLPRALFSASDAALPCSYESNAQRVGYGSWNMIKSASEKIT